MSKPENTILVGRIGAVYGVKGWLKVLSFTDNLENIFDYQPWLIGREGFWQETKIVEWRRHNKGLIVKLDGVDVREKAQQLTGMDIIVRSEQLPELPDDEFYWRDLVGLQVVNLAGYNMGTVTSLMETGSNDVLVVKANANDAFSIPERLIPFIDEQVIKSVDIKAQLITVDWDADF